MKSDWTSKWKVTCLNLEGGTVGGPYRITDDADINVFMSKYHSDNKYFIIEEVVRISDGAVFTVGEEVYFPRFNGHEHHVISHIVFAYGDICFRTPKDDETRIFDHYFPCVRKTKERRKVQITNEELIRIHHRYLTDGKIATWQAQIEAMYKTAVPKVLASEGSYQLSYDSRITVEAGKIGNEMLEYIKIEYPELIVTEV